MPTASRGELHDLIDHLPESELHAVHVFLRFVHAQAEAAGSSAGRFWVGRRPSDDELIIQEADPTDPVALALANAPEDDEPSTTAEDVIADARWQSYRRGDWVSHEDIKAEIGW